MRLGGKVALVTGAARGIGNATAKRLVEEGAKVVCADLNDVEPFSASMMGIKLDVTNESDWEAAAKLCSSTYGRLDVLVNNAGIISHNAVEAETMESWTREIAVNQTSVWLGMRAVAPEMRKNGGGSIINISSVWGIIAVPSAIAYHASKAAVDNMTRCAAVLYAKENIRVNSVHPGLVLTDMVRAQAAAITQKVLDVTPMGRGAQPSEIASGIAFLASNDSSFMTGARLVLDGGMTAQ